MIKYRFAPRAPLRLTMWAVLLQLPLHFAYAAEDTNTQSMGGSAVETNVKSAIGQVKDITSPGDIAVEDKSGVVTLSGTVSNSMEAKHAVDAAKSVSGVSKVEDKLVRKSSTGMEASPHQSETINAPMKEKKGMHEGMPD